MLKLIQQIMSLNGTYGRLRSGCSILGASREMGPSRAREIIPHSHGTTLRVRGPRGSTVGLGAAGFDGQLPAQTGSGSPVPPAPPTWPGGNVDRGLPAASRCQAVMVTSVYQAPSTGLSGHRSGVRGEWVTPSSGGDFQKVEPQVLLPFGR